MTDLSELTRAQLRALLKATTDPDERKRVMQAALAAVLEAPPEGVRIGKLNRLFLSYVPDRLKFTREWRNPKDLARVRTSGPTQYVPQWVARVGKLFTYRSSVAQYAELIVRVLAMVEATPSGERLELIAAMDTVTSVRGMRGLQEYVTDRLPGIS